MVVSILPKASGCNGTGLSYSQMLWEKYNQVAGRNGKLSEENHAFRSMKGVSLVSRKRASIVAVFNLNRLRGGLLVAPTLQGKTCPYCRYPIKNKADIMVCPGCKLPHHRECWQENRGCTTFACKGVAVRGQDSAEIDPSFDELAAEYGSGRLVIDLEDLVAIDNVPHSYERIASHHNSSRDSESGLQFTRRLKALTVAGLLSGVLFSIIFSLMGSFYDFFTYAFAGGVIGAGIGLVEGIITKQPYKKLYGASIGFMIAFFGVGITAIAFYGYFSGYAIDLIFFGLIGAAVGIGHGLSSGGGRKVKTSLIGGLLGGVSGSVIMLLIENIYFYFGNNFTLIIFSMNVILIALGIGLAHERSKKAWLRVISGATAGVDYFIDKEKMTIGSCSGCDIVLVNDPDVVLHHAEITYVNGFEIKVIENAPDLLINNKRVRSDILLGGEEVVIGHYRLKFSRKTRTIQAPTIQN